MRKILVDRTNTLYVIGDGRCACGTYKLIWDDDSGITWYDYVVIQFDTTDITNLDPNHPDFLTTWTNQKDWAEKLVVVFNDQAFDDWRLPEVAEMKKLKEQIDSNAYLDIDQHWQTGSPFSSNLLHDWFWTGTEGPGPNATTAKIYNFNLKKDDVHGKESGVFNSIAVRPGCVSNPPPKKPPISPPTGFKIKPS